MSDITPRVFNNGNGAYICSKCSKILQLPSIAFTHEVVVFCRMGHRIAYCSEYCYKKHNHREHLIPFYQNKIKRLENQNKQYLSNLKMYGYGQS